MNPDAKSWKLNQLLWQIPFPCFFLEKVFFFTRILRDFAELIYLVIFPNEMTLFYYTACNEAKITSLCFSFKDSYTLKLFL